MPLIEVLPEIIKIPEKFTVLVKVKNLKIRLVEIPVEIIEIQRSKIK
ncbi:MAG: hypothetical protein Q8R26_00270 [bacterium]|nr:hypothetical protein [bacterium]